MKGISYIRSLFGLTTVDLAKFLGITKQAISKYEKGATIPKERLDQLEEIFIGISRNWYDKEIDELDMLKIQKEKNQNDSSNISKINELEKQVIKEQLKEKMVEVVEILTETEDEEFLERVKAEISNSKTKEDLLNNIKELLSNYNK